MKLFAELKKRHFFKDTSIDFLGFRNVHNVYIPIENVDLHGIVVSLKKKITDNSILSISTKYPHHMVLKSVYEKPDYA